MAFFVSECEGAAPGVSAVLDWTHASEERRPTLSTHRRKLWTEMCKLYGWLSLRRASDFLGSFCWHHMRFAQDYFLMMNITRLAASNSRSPQELIGDLQRDNIEYVFASTWIIVILPRQTPALHERVCVCAFLMCCVWFSFSIISDSLRCAAGWRTSCYGSQGAVTNCGGKL